MFFATRQPLVNDEEENKGCVEFSLQSGVLGQFPE